MGVHSTTGTTPIPITQTAYDSESFPTPPQLVNAESNQYASTGEINSHNTASDAQVQSTSKGDANEASTNVAQSNVSVDSVNNLEKNVNWKLLWEGVSSSLNTRFVPVSQTDDSSVKHQVAGESSQKIDTTGSVPNASQNNFQAEILANNNKEVKYLQSIKY